MPPAVIIARQHTQRMRAGHEAPVHNCIAKTSLPHLNPVRTGATMTLMFSSPVLPGGPNAAAGSA